MGYFAMQLISSIRHKNACPLVFKITATEITVASLKTKPVALYYIWYTNLTRLSC